MAKVDADGSDDIFANQPHHICRIMWRPILPIQPSVLDRGRFPDLDCEDTVQSVQSVHASRGGTVVLYWSVHCLGI